MSPITDFTSGTKWHRGSFTEQLASGWRDVSTNTEGARKQKNVRYGLSLIFVFSIDLPAYLVADFLIRRFFLGGLTFIWGLVFFVFL